MSLDKPTQFRRYISSNDLLAQGSIVVFNVAGRAFIVPIQIPVTLTIDRLGWLQQSVSAGNVRQGLYRDMGDTPLAGPLIVETASVAKAGTLRKMETVITATQLSPGLYWLGVMSDETTSNYACHTTESTYGGTLLCYYYDRGGGYGAFTNPCPALTGTNNAPIQFVRVKSIP